MSAYERKIRKLMKTENCDRAKAERFYELSMMLTSENFTAMLGKQIYAELAMLRKA